MGLHRDSFSGFGGGQTSKTRRLSPRYPISSFYSLVDVDSSMQTIQP